MSEHSSHSLKRLSLNSSRTPDSEVSVSQINAQFFKGIRPDLVLYDAACKNDVATIKKVILLGIDLNQKSYMDRSAIHWAIINDNVEIVSLLLDANCDVEAADKFGMRPILMAAMRGSTRIAKMLINAGCDVTVVNKKQYTVLHCAVKHDQNEMITYLLDNVSNLDINALNDQGQTCLTMACMNNNLEVVDKLIEAGADVNLKDKQHRTAAHWASFKGHHEVLTSLLKSGIDADEKDLDGKTALHLSAEYGYKKTSRTMIEHDCDIHATDSKGRTALMIAAALGYQEVVSMLVQFGANLNTKDMNGNTALHLCVMGNHVAMTKFLVENKANINSLNNRCQTPLVVAAELGHIEAAEVLIKSQADLFATEKSGRTALYIASRGSFQTLVDMIIRAERERFLRIKSNCSTDNGTFISTDLDTQTQSDYNEEMYTTDVPDHSLNRKLLYYLSKNHLEANDWKQLARFWDFTEDQIKAIEHQYTGKASYKDHAYRMLLIWLHGLSPAKSALDELYDALIYINKQDVAEKLRKKAIENQHYNSNGLHCRCLPAISSSVCHYCCIA